MNIMSLVMGLLLIFACTFSLSLRKAAINQRVEKTYQAHMNASRKIRNSYESICYEQLRSVSKEPKEKEHQNANSPQPKKKAEKLNFACARLNLWPLIVDGAEKHPALYETAAQILSSFYSKPLFNEEPRFEYCLLNSIIEAAHQANTDPNNSYLLLEKLLLKNLNVKQLYSTRSIYYRMLRGTKSIKADQRYPSLLDYFTIENKNSRICLHHASSKMIVALFGSRAGSSIYNELQTSKTDLSLDRLQELCSQNGNLALSEEFLKLIDLRSIDPPTSGQKVLVKEDADVCLKQKVFFPS